MMNWKKQLSQTITDYEELKKRLPLFKEEIAWFESEEKPLLPLNISPLFFDLILQNPTDKKDPIRLQSIPRLGEFSILDYEKTDPLQEKEASPFPGLVHRYRRRVLLYAGTNCAHSCRHCFRRHLSQKPLSIYNHLNDLEEWLPKHPEVKEILLSGADPLLASNQKIAYLLQTIRSCDPSKDDPRLIRLCTRTLTTLPARFDRPLIKLLQNEKAIWLVVQINHPKEITQEATKSIEKVRKAGIPILSQTVLLKGVNDEVNILKRLFEKLVVLGIKPYYLFQGDLAAGTSHFRVPLQRGVSLMKALRKELSGIALPTYAVDLPQGGGKVPLTESYLVEEKEEGFFFASPFMETKQPLFFYPKEGK